MGRGKWGILFQGSPGPMLTRKLNRPIRQRGHTRRQWQRCRWHLSSLAYIREPSRQSRSYYSRQSILCHPHQKPIPNSGLKPEWAFGGGVGHCPRVLHEHHSMSSIAVYIYWFGEGMSREKINFLKLAFESLGIFRLLHKDRHLPAIHRNSLAPRTIRSFSR